MGRVRTIWVALTVAALLLGGSLPAKAGSAKATTKKASAGKAPAKKTVTSSSKKRSKRRSARRGAWKRRGQQKIASERVREIQEALIREKYLDGEASGVWDDRTKAAMTRYQAHNGWQTKITPDSRALIKLGLGPNMAGLLNPSSAILPTAPAAGGGELERLAAEDLPEEEVEPEIQE